MDAVEFIKEYWRMCETSVKNGGCCCCPAYIQNTGSGCSINFSNANRLVLIVEQWSQDHPQKTMMQDFFEKFPNAPKTILGFPYPCAKDLGYPRLDSCSFGLKNTPGAFCKECWSRPMKD